MDEQGILGVEGWPEANPDQKFTVTVDSGKQDPDSSTEIKEQVKESTSIPKPESSPDFALNVKSEIDFLSSKCSQYMKTYDINLKRAIMIRLPNNALELLVQQMPQSLSHH